MASRELATELEMLTQNLGMSREEALQALGLEADDPLLADDNEAISIAESLSDEVNTVDAAKRSTHTNHPADHIVEMFPQISREIILKTWDHHNGDFVAVSDELLNFEVIQTELRQNNSENTTNGTNHSNSRRKGHKELKRQVRKQQQQLQHEETDIEFIAQELKISLAEARQLYWTHDSDVTTVMMAKMPKQPLVSVNINPMSIGRGQVVNSPKQAADGVDTVGVYADVPYLELKNMIDEAQVRINTLTSMLRETDRSKPHNSVRLIDVQSDLRHWKKEHELMQLAMAKPKWLRQRELPARTLDLHGLTLEQAQVVASDAIRKFRNSQHSELEIITGAGRHSIQGRAVIKPWLREYLKFQNMRMRELDGSFIVSQKPLI